MLSEQQIQAARAKYGVAPTQSKLSEQDVQAARKKYGMQSEAPVEQAPEKSTLDKIGSIAGLDVLGKKIGGNIAKLIPIPKVIAPVNYKGSQEEFQKTQQKQYQDDISKEMPTTGQTIGAGLKLASTVIPAGKLVAGGLALKGAVAGGANSLGQSMVEQKNLPDTLIDTAAGAAIGGAAGKALEVAPKLLKFLGAKTTGIGMESSEATKRAVQSYQANQPTLFERVSNLVTGKKIPVSMKPITEAETVANKLMPGTEWRLGVNAKRVQGKLWDETIKPALRSTKDRVDMKSFFKELAADVVKENPDLSRRNTLLNALEALKGDFNKVSKVGFEKLQDYKAGWAKFVPERAYKGQPIAGALNEIRNMAAGKARDLIYKKLGPEVQRAYIDYSNLSNIVEEGIKGSKSIDKSSFSRAIWDNMMDKAVTPVTSSLGKVLYKTGQGLELVGEQGMKTVREVLNK